MKNILILSFMHDDPLILRKFELLREHYNKMIDYFCFPIKFYGVRSTQDGETRIDEENQIIWLHTDNIKEYDKRLVLRVIDCFKFILNSNIEYDVIIKTNTSFLINLIYANKLIQSDKCNEHTMITSFCDYNCAMKENYSVFRGNFITLFKSDIELIVNTDIEQLINEYVENRIFEYSYDMKYHHDDCYISYILKNKKTDICSVGMYTLTNNSDKNVYTVIENIDGIIKSLGITVKDYQNNKQYNYDELDFLCVDIIIMKLFINYIEKVYIQSKDNVCISFTCEDY